MYRVWDYISAYSLLLIAGTLVALFWANLDPDSYHTLVHYVLIDDFLIGEAQAEGGSVQHVLTLHFLVNDVFMAFFFAIAGKEVWEALILEQGSLRGRRALTPLVATAGGMLGPVAVYLGLAAWLGIFADVAHGWAVPTATDIAFSYLVGRLVFGAGHPAVRFLLLLAIADDAAGLLILAFFYPTAEVQPLWLLLSVGASAAAYLLFNWLPRRLDGDDPLRPASSFVRKRLTFWPYLLAGVISWYGFQEAGIHPALGLLPVIPAIPHADRGFGIFAEAEQYLHDLLNTIEHALKRPVEVGLFFFGLMNAGVEFSAMSAVTWLVVLGLLVGKPVGIFLFGTLAARGFGFGLPEGMRLTDLFVLGCVAAIGFTVALFVATVAFASGPLQDAAKMGALLSFAAAGISLIAGRLGRVVKVDG